MKKNIQTTFLLCCILLFLGACKSREEKLKSIDLVVITYKKPLISFEINSKGIVHEFQIDKIKKTIRFYEYRLTSNQQDEIENMLGEMNFTQNEFEGVTKDNCVDGVSYDFGVKLSSGESLNREGVICNQRDIMDTLILYILDVAKSSSKQTLFKKYVEYEKINNDFDSLLGNFGNASN